MQSAQFRSAQAGQSTDDDAHASPPGRRAQHSADLTFARHVDAYDELTLAAAAALDLDACSDVLRDKPTPPHLFEDQPQRGEDLARSLARGHCQQAVAESDDAGRRQARELLRTEALGDVEPDILSIDAQRAALQPVALALRQPDLGRLPDQNALTVGGVDPGCNFDPSVVEPVLRHFLAGEGFAMPLAVLIVVVGEPGDAGFPFAVGSGALTYDASH
jgi:hypothetical protein